MSAYKSKAMKAAIPNERQSSATNGPRSGLAVSCLVGIRHTYVQIVMPTEKVGAGTERRGDRALCREAHTLVQRHRQDPSGGYTGI